MLKKKSYMNRKNILNEGFFEKLKALLKGDSRVTKHIKNMNKAARSLETRLNKRAKARGEKGNIKLHTFTVDDFIRK